MIQMIKRQWQRFVALPTAVHLWCAERELRVAKTNGATPEQQRARARNLDLLSEYVRRGEFPENVHDASAFAPCFVDSAGRQCAVAFLLDQSGNQAALETIRLNANFAQIEDMHFAELDAWASQSGLTKAELARIQPGYPPTVADIDSFAYALLPILMVWPTALTSILFNVGRVMLGYPSRTSTIGMGVISGVLTICLALQLPWYPLTPLLNHRMEVVQWLSFLIGLLAIVCGLAAWCVQRVFHSKPLTEPERIGRLDDPVPSASSEHIQVMEPGRFKAGPPTDVD